MRSCCFLARWIVLGLLLLAVSGCGEMYHQPAYRPEDPPRLVPALGAIPVTGLEPTYAGVDGKNLFNTFCIPCHGLQGKGNGPVASAYAPQPADLTSPGIQGLADGELFLVITNGFSTMPSFRKQLQPDERWDVVNYVRSFGQKP